MKSPIAEDLRETVYGNIVVSDEINFKERDEIQVKRGIVESL